LSLSVQFKCVVVMETALLYPAVGGRSVSLSPLVTS
jgi:hypothetical protein